MPSREVVILAMQALKMQREIVTCIQHTELLYSMKEVGFDVFHMLILANHCANPECWH